MLNRILSEHKRFGLSAKHRYAASLRPFVMPVISLLLLVFVSTFLFSQSARPKSPVIEWEAVKGAGGYQIELMKDGRVLINQKTQSTSYALDPSILSPGVYKLRVSTLDRNQDVASNSPWINIYVKERKVAGRKYLYVGIGWSYNILLQNWNKIASNSARDFQLYGGYDYFKPIGFDLSLAYTALENKGRDDIVFQNLALFSALPGVYYTRPFNENFSLFVRVAGGLSSSTMKVLDGDEKETHNSIDPALAATIALRSEYGRVFMDSGFELMSVVYSSSPLFDVRVFFRIGARF